MKERSLITTLIHKSLTGALSPEGRQILDNWLSESPSNQQTAEEVKAVWEASNAYFTQSEPDVNSGLARLKANIIQETAIAAAVPQATSKPKPIMRYLFRVAAVAALVAALFFAWNATSDEVGSSDIVRTNLDEQTDIMLDDGTLVFLNDDSYLEKLTTFNTDSRKVVLKGEAFFEVAKDPSRPFSVKTQNLEIEVLGTAFNVYAPAKGASLEEIVVDHGKVKVTTLANGKTFFLENGDRLTYNLDSKTTALSKDLQQNAQSWRSGKLEFNDTPLEDVIFVIEKHFDINIECKNKKMLACPFTATAFDNANIEVVMATLETALGLKLKHNKGSKNYKFTEGNCN